MSGRHRCRSVAAALVLVGGLAWTAPAPLHDRVRSTAPEASELWHEHLVAAGLWVAAVAAALALASQRVLTIARRSRRASGHARPRPDRMLRRIIALGATASLATPALPLQGTPGTQSELGAAPPEDPPEPPVLRGQPGPPEDPPEPPVLRGQPEPPVLRVEPPGVGSEIPTPSPPPPPESWEIAPGDHLWRVAEETLRDRWGRAPTAAEVAPYWHQVIERNRHRLVDACNPDLVHPGQVMELPDPPAG